MFVRTLSLEALKQTTGTVGSCEVKTLIILEDMAIDDEVNLKLCRAFCGIIVATTVNGGVNSCDFFVVSYCQHEKKALVRSMHLPRM
jgi:hypothetical protein